MKVLHVTYEFPGQTENCGGGGQATAQLDRSLSDYGIQSRVVTDTTGGHWATFPIRRHGAISDAVASFQPDLLHGHFSLPSSLLLPRISRRADIPLVITAMGADVYDPSRYRFLRPLADRVNQWLFAAADAVTVPSRDMAARIQSKHNISPTRIPHSIDTNSWTWRARTQPSDPEILTVARLVERKRLERGIQAVESLRDDGWAATYRLVGTGPLTADMEALAADRDWLEVAGYVDDIRAAYGKADLFLLPSDHEAFGMVLLEALASGLPCVTTEAGGQSDIVNSDVGAVTQLSARALAAGLRDVLQRYSEAQPATKQYVASRYDISVVARRYADLYRRLTASGQIVA